LLDAQRGHGPYDVDGGRGGRIVRLRSCVAMCDGPGGAAPGAGQGLSLSPGSAALWI
jgi:hypothetical protein